MLKCAILKEIFYQDSISGIKKIAYEKNKGRNRQMEDADVSQKVLKQLYKTEFNKLTPEDIESVKRVIYKYMNQSGASVIPDGPARQGFVKTMTEAGLL